MSAMSVSDLCRALSLAIEEAGASPQLRKCSVLAAGLQKRVANIESRTNVFRWLVERTDGKFLRVSDQQILDWTDENAEALHFARREDADAMAGLCESDDCSAVEHGWM